MNWKIAKTVHNVTIRYNNSSELKGNIFISAEEGQGSSKTEQILNVLNGEGLFFPFVILGEQDVMLINKDHILSLSPEESVLPDEALMKTNVTIELKSGGRIRGVFFINYPEGSRRVQDFLNLSGRFFPVYAGGSFMAVNKDYVINVTDEGHA